MVVSVDDHFKVSMIETIKPEINHDDIRSFISGHIEHFEEIRPNTLDEDFSEDIVGTFSEQAGGM